MKTDNLKIRFHSIDYNQKNKDLISRIIEVADRISKLSRRGAGDTIYVGSEMYERLYNMQTPTTTRPISGYSGNDYLSSGYTYSPYIPMMEIYSGTTINRHGI